MDYAFTASMEETLDTVAAGDVARLQVLENFYRGGHGIAGRDFPGLNQLVAGLGDIDARGISTFPIRDSDAVLRVGRYGPYLESDGERANVPPDMAPDELTATVAQELLAMPSGDRELGVDPASGNVIVAKTGRYGPYVTELLPEEPEPEPVADGEKKPKRRAKAKVKPRTASLFKDMSLDTITFDEAMKLLSLPRVVASHPEDGEEILARNGRYGPYITWNKESRSLPDEPSLFTIDLDGALKLLAEPKKRGRAAADPGKEIGPDPTTESMIMLKDGRFGPYVTDGETNASLRVADDPNTITLQRAIELLADRRAAGPPKKRAKKTAAKKAPAKKAAKKAPAKKAPAKKAAKKTATKVTAK